MSSPIEKEKAPEPNPNVGPSSQYEFAPAQNALIGSLADKMTFVGLFGLSLGLLALLAGIARFDPAALILGLVYILVGVWTRSAGGSFREVVRTHGADISHLMNALESLRKFYSLMYWLGIVAIAALVILLTAQLLGGPPTVPDAGTTNAPAVPA